jgi:serine protease AprX
MRKKITTLALLSCFSSLFAQTDEQREVIKASMNESVVQKSSKKLQQKQQEEKNKVAEYLKAHPEVQRQYQKNGKTYFLSHISSDGKPIYITTKDLRQVNNTKANALHTGGNLGINISGTNMVAGVWDGGAPNKDHALLKGKVTMQTGQSTTLDDHMTAVTGIMVAKNTSNARGIAHDATTKNYDWENDVTEMDAFGKDGYLISNHSYGYGNDDKTPLWTFGAYDVQTKQWDAMLKNRPYYLPFVAAGNEQVGSGNPDDKGFDIITGNSAAKNVVTVGAVELDNTMSNYSNWGPTDDGRIKPEIVTLGTAIDVPLHNNNTKTTGNDESSTGTSYASPAAAAGALLLQQYYYSLNNSYMKAAMLKALLLHSADDDASGNGPDNKFGWGILNLENAANIIKQNSLANGSAQMKMITTNPANDELAEVSQEFNYAKGKARASLCWTDDEGKEQFEADGVDNTTSRMVYNFSMKFEQVLPAKASFPYKNMLVTKPSAAATVGSKWFESANNYLQANLADTTDNAKGKISIRKSKASPKTTREMALIVTGLKKGTQSALSTNDISDKNTSIVFYDKTSDKLKLIAQENNAFGEFSIYTLDGKLIKNGQTSENEIQFEAASGAYIINYQQNNQVVSHKFIK